jgi:uncharacterized membrane protein YhaH (DUF805 family)
MQSVVGILALVLVINLAGTGLALLSGSASGVRRAKDAGLSALQSRVFGAAAILISIAIVVGLSLGQAAPIFGALVWAAVLLTFEFDHRGRPTPATVFLMAASLTVVLIAGGIELTSFFSLPGNEAG